MHEKILLVDDNTENLQVLSQTLEGRGYEIFVATNGETALAIAAKVLPELILLDVLMPGIDGFEVCRRLKKQPKTARADVIFLSALGEVSDKVRGLDVGAVDYITKPFQAAEVIARVNAHLTNQRLRSQLMAANARMKRDLEAASRIQRSLLPAKTPHPTKFEFAWEYSPCDELAGDSLNVFRLDEEHIGFYVLDVVGHGVRAALLSFAATHALTPRADRTSVVMTIGANGDASTSSVVSPASVAKHVNQIFQFKNDDSQFFTLLYGLLDTGSGRIRFVSAGHPRPIHFPSNGKPKETGTYNYPIGVVDNAMFDEFEVRLLKGDRLFLYSDGLLEQKNETDQPFGIRNIISVINEGQRKSLAESVELLKNRVASWCNESLSDDLSILAIQCDQ
jgi:sigma-B regulation protein RsbU (phosphoserine phosphatase)